MEIISLTKGDAGLLAARFGEHGNSQRRMLAALEEAAANEAYTRLVVLRTLEKQLAVDLGMVCHHFEHRNDATTHPFETAVMNYVAHWRVNRAGGEDLWVRLDRIREVREIVEEGRLVGAPEQPERSGPEAARP
ncbi:MAG: hypothetical protein ACT443_09145 [Gemmatimonadota bacterium]